MKVLIVGVNGQLGRLLIKYILARGFRAKAIVQTPIQASYFQEIGAETVTLDLKHHINDLAQVAENVDAVVYTGDTKWGEQYTLLGIDNAIQFMEAIRFAGVNRFVHISTFETQKGEWTNFPKYFRPLMIENYYVDQWLRLSELDYTIIHPGTLTDHKGTGLVKLGGNDLKNGNIPREDVAKVVLACLENQITIRKEFKLTSGKTPIHEALTAYFM